MARVSRTDISVLRPVERRSDGTILADAILTRCGVFEYHQPDGSVRRELRLPEDIFDPKSLKSFEGRPLTNDHPPEMIDAKNAKEFAVGALIGNVTPDGESLRGRLSIYDANTVAAMENGKVQTSVGYVCDLAEGAGEHPKYGKYDARQTNIIANHISLVDKGRAGSAHVRMDGATLFHEEWIGPDPALLAAEHRKDNWSDEAREASAAARKSGTAGDHLKALNANLAAFKAAHAAGDDKTANLHAKAMGEHAKAAQKVAEKVSKKIAAGPKGPDRDTSAQVFANMRATREAGKLLAKRTATDSVDAPFASTTAEYSWVDTKYFNGKEDIADMQNSCHALYMPKVHTDANAKPDPGDGSAHDGGDASGQTPAAGDGATHGVSAKGDPDSKDLAHQNASGSNKNKVSARGAAPGGPDTGQASVTALKDADPDDDDDDDDDCDPDDEDCDDDDTDAYADCMDADGDLSDDDRTKMAAASFAVPKRKGLPIHDPKHTEAAMDRFGKYAFKDADEKHAGFNRILKKAKQFSVSSAKFQQEHASKLDRLDDKDITFMNDLKKAQTDLANATARLDSATSDLATAQGKITSLQADLDALKKARTDTAADIDAKIESKVALIAEAASAGVKTDAKMTDRAIRCAVIKSVDKIDVADTKHEAYVEALYEGALSRAKKDAADTVAGAAALGAVRTTVETARTDATVKTDDNDEAAANSRMRARTLTEWATPVTKQENN